MGIPWRLIPCFAGHENCSLQRRTCWKSPPANWDDQQNHNSSTEIHFQKTRGTVSTHIHIYTHIHHHIHIRTYMYPHTQTNTHTHTHTHTHSHTQTHTLTHHRNTHKTNCLYTHSSSSSPHQGAREWEKFPATILERTQGTLVPLARCPNPRGCHTRT